MSVPPATHLGAHMLSRRRAWVHFFLIIPGCRARQVGFRALGLWAGEYRPGRRKGAPDQLGGPFHRRHMWTPTQIHIGHSTKWHNPQIKESPL